MVLEAVNVEIVRGGHTVVGDVTLSIESGELIAIVGSSGAGKSSLLDALAGVRPPARGNVHVDGMSADDPARRNLVGYVPQDDVIHRDLPVRATLRYAARLRLPASTPGGAIDAAVTETLDRLGLTDRAEVRVRDLSGGQRKRVSIGVELLTRPRVFFLDEPTSGLDPSTGAHLVELLRQLADEGTTVVFTTHNPEDLGACDRTIRVDGGTAYVTAGRAPRRRHGPAEAAAVARVAGAGAVTQWRVLARRSLDTLRRNRLTMAIMVGAPAAVITMFVMLFRAGALDADTADAAAAISTTYWMAFAAFFFGLTYGLLQICTEFPILRRERFVGLRVGSYLAAKVTVLTPLLALVNISMLAVLRTLDRLPALTPAAYARLATTLTITSLAALALGLLTSAAVSDTSQATLALPMLCFPAVLFAGVLVPLSTMPFSGRILSVAVEARWSFEALGRDLGLPGLFRADRSGAGQAALAHYHSTFDHVPAGRWAVLVVFAAASLSAGAGVIHQRTRPYAGRLRMSSSPTSTRAPASIAGQPLPIAAASRASALTGE